MWWRILLVVLVACNRRVAAQGDEGSTAAAPAGLNSAPATGPGIDFVCPLQPLAEGTACTRPPNERCKYFVGSEMRCFVCDKSGHWTRVHC